MNQTPPLPDYDLYSTDPALREAVRREGAPGHEAALREAGIELGTAEWREHARLANRNPPILHTHDVRGERIDRVEFHPSWHVLMRAIVARGYHCSPWSADAEREIPGAHVGRAAGYFLQAQVESGTLCPTTMTYGGIAAVRRDARLAAQWLPRLLTLEYDPRDLPVERKRGALLGMGMTERQGGSDVRTNTTQAVAAGDGSYRIRGHKWFFSAPQCDAHLVLAQTAAGLSCLFMPRILPDGTRNSIRLQRLKDKLGNRSNASSEVEFDDAWGVLLGEEGRGISTILEMGTYTRLDCVIGTAGLMRAALVNALHHARHRRAFGAPLRAQPLMRTVLADLALESEAATALSLRLARAFDSESAAELAWRRVLTSAAKFWVCKRGCELACEAMEVLGGNGYTEDLPLARIVREMPVNSIWEGSGNIMCLDVLRALARTPSSREVLLAELEPVRGRQAQYDEAFERLARALKHDQPSESQARAFSGTLTVLAQAKLLLDGAAAGAPGASAVAEGFCRTRLEPQSGWGPVFGTSTASIDEEAILERASPFQP
jgi:putative acyl-CoA dehydrogenase